MWGWGRAPGLRYQNPDPNTEHKQASSTVSSPAPLGPGMGGGLWPPGGMKTPAGTRLPSSPGAGQPGMLCGQEPTPTPTPPSQVSP